MLLLPCFLLAAGAVGAGKLKTFGTGRSAFSNAGPEKELFNYTVTGGADSIGVMTHFWTTGDTDKAVFQYYIDGEAEASISFTAPKAAGAIFGDSNMWGNAMNGKGGSIGGWYVNYKIPFGSSVRITVTGRIGNGFVILRGCENLPINVGAITLPTTARLQLQRIEAKVFQPLDWVPIVDIPSNKTAPVDGLVYMTAIAANSTSSNFWEGCYHLYTPYEQEFPGTVLSTGMEDFFDSAYGFGGGEYKYPVSGCTHRQAHGKGMALSAYRFHEEDPIAFTDGVKFQWRIGDLINAKTHPESPKCFIDKKGPGDQVVGAPAETEVTSYAWVYSWPSEAEEEAAAEV